MHANTGLLGQILRMPSKAVSHMSQRPRLTSADQTQISSIELPANRQTRLVSNGATRELEIDAVMFLTFFRQFRPVFSAFEIHFRVFTCFYADLICFG